MGIHHYWLVDQHVLYAYHWDKISIQELNAASDYAIHQFRDSDRKQVHLIVDMRDLKTYPRNVRELSHATSIVRQNNLGWLIMLTQDHTISFLASTVTQVVAKARFRSFQYPDDAFDFLLKADRDLAPDAFVKAVLRQQGDIPDQFYARQGG